MKLNEFVENMHVIMAERKRENWSHDSTQTHTHWYRIKSIDNSQLYRFEMSTPADFIRYISICVCVLLFFLSKFSHLLVKYSDLLLVCQIQSTIISHIVISSMWKDRCAFFFSPHSSWLHMNIFVTNSKTP